MQILCKAGGMAYTNCYLVLDEPTRTAALIDAPENTTSGLLKLAKDQGYHLDYLVLTHGHFDHVSDHKIVTDAFPKAKVLIHRRDEAKLEHPEHSEFPLPYIIPPRKADGHLEEGQHLAIGSLDFLIMHTPGHCGGLVCLYCEKEKTAFVGDLLMAGSVGRDDLTDSNPAAHRDSLTRLMALPDDTKIYSGHGPETTIGRERKRNPILRSWGIVS
ncbi:MAG: MBL fold metallo-hydrolase [Phycisphaerae bacterium]